MDGEKKFPINEAMQNYMLIGGIGIILLGFLLAMIGALGKSLSITSFGAGIMPLGIFTVGGALVMMGASLKQEHNVYRAALIIGGVMLLNGLSMIAKLIN